MPCYCNGLTFYSGKLCLALLLWSWCHGWVGGASIFFQISASSKGAASAARGAQGTTLEPLSVVPHAHGVVENLFSTASGPVSTVLRSRSGAAFCCWLGTWFHTALLCCNGPCPHDPPRCRLNSSPSHTDAMRNLPQFANPSGSARCCLATALAFTFYSGNLCATPLLVDWCHGWVGWGANLFSNLFFHFFVPDLGLLEGRCIRSQRR